MNTENLSFFSSGVDGSDLLNVIGGYHKGRFFYQAFSTGIFEHLTSQAESGERIARKMECQPERIEFLLDALTAMGLAEKSAGFYKVSDTASTYLKQDSAFYLGDFIDLEFGEKKDDGAWEMMDSWLKGNSQDKKHQPQEVFNPAFIRAMAQGVLVDDSIVKTMALIGDHPCFEGQKNLLDLGGGHGLFAIALQKKHPDLKIAVFDLPQAQVVTNEYQKNYGTTVTFHPGNFYEDPLPEGQDVVLAFDILHPVTPAKKEGVFKEVYAALNSGGTLFYKLWFLDEERISPERAAIFSLKLKITNAGSHVYTLQEAKAMLRQIGFEIEGCRAFDDKGSTIIIARKN
ncbi:3-hydroxy-5-methyl-1-naphthoate 3-O-methyltransferase [anaerobic digester metagenome]